MAHYRIAALIRTSRLFHIMEMFLRNKLATILVALLMLSGGAVPLGACNTTAGAGEDIASAGRAISDAAEDAH
jgi:predicted small secreted protein